MSGALPKLTFACGLYDRMVPLYAGEVAVDGVDLTFLANDDPTDLFTRALRGEFDASELSITHCVRLAEAGNSPFVAIPAFPSRVFRHGQIAVRDGAGINQPADLNGRRIAVPDFGMTAAVWIRGILQNEFGVDCAGIEWVQNPSVQRSGAALPALRDRPMPHRITANDSGKPLAQLLIDGDVDAFIGADLPKQLRGNSHVRRLFPDYRAREAEFFERTRIFPIMHTVVIRREIHERIPHFAGALYTALNRSKDIARERMRYMGTLRAMVPWLIAELEEADAIFGGDPFAYGIEPNRNTLEAFIGYMHQQSFLDREIACNDIFTAL